MVAGWTRLSVPAGSGCGWRPRSQSSKGLRLTGTAPIINGGAWWSTSDTAEAARQIVAGGTRHARGAVANRPVLAPDLLIASGGTG
jgi:hypothetical protein